MFLGFNVLNLRGYLQYGQILRTLDTDDRSSCYFTGVVVDVSKSGKKRRGESCSVKKQLMIHGLLT